MKINTRKELITLCFICFFVGFCICLLISETKQWISKPLLLKGGAINSPQNGMMAWSIRRIKGIDSSFIVLAKPSKYNLAGLFYDTIDESAYSLPTGEINGSFYFYSQMPGHPFSTFMVNGHKIHNMPTNKDLVILIDGRNYQIIEIEEGAIHESFLRNNRLTDKLLSEFIDRVDPSWKTFLRRLGLPNHHLIK